MALSTEEKQIIQFGKQQGKSREEVLNALSKFRSQEQVTQPSPLGQEERQGFVEGVKTSFGERRERIAAGQQRAIVGEQSTAETLFQGVTETVGGAFDIAIEGIKAVTPDKIGETIKKRAANIFPSFAQSPIGKLLGLGAKKFEELSPRAQDNVRGVIELIAVAPVTRGAKIAVEATIPIVKEAARVTGETIPRIFQRVTPQFVRDFQKRLAPSTQKESVDIMVDAFKKSFVIDNATVNKKLDKLARSQSFKGKKVTSDDLIRDLAEAGVFPTIPKGSKLVKFDDVFDNIVSRQNRLAENINPVLKTVPERTLLESLRKQAQEALKRSQVVENLPQAQRQLDTFFKSFETKWGKQLSAEHVNQIRIAMNSRTKAFGEEAFKQDTANIVADIMRKRIDELVPSKNVRDANLEWGKLQNIKKTAQIFDNQPVKVGFLGDAFGRYMGVLGISSIGFSAGGPGGLVVAFLAAKIGGDAVAQLIRSKRFIGRARENLIKSIQQDDEIVRKLINEASEAEKAFLERVLLPAPSETFIPLGSKTGESSVRVIEAAKGEPGRIPKGQPGGGKFFKTFKSN